MSIDKQRFLAAKAQAAKHADGGVGTLSERMLHRTLKYYIDENTENHEREYLGSIADILNSDGVTEIQTRSLERLSPKLAKYLPNTRVRVVYPIAKIRTMSWLDVETGEITAPRKVARKGRPSDALTELYKIGEYLTNENLEIQLFIINTDEIKLKNGRGKDKKHGATRLERVPTELVDIVTLRTPEDYALLIPEALPDTFLANEFYRATSLHTRRAYYALMLLCTMGALTREKHRRAYVYKRVLTAKKHD